MRQYSFPKHIQFSILILNLVFILQFIIPGNSFALSATQHIKFDRISIEDGLSQVTVYSLLQDYRGFIWIGTMDGLNKYDGYNFRIYRHSPFDSVSITNNRIRAIYEDSQNKLWIGTDRGLNYYDPDTDTFESFIYNPDQINSISSDFIQSICEDSSGFIWIGTDAGLNRFDPKTRMIKRYHHNPKDYLSLVNNNITSLILDHNDILWIGTGDGLCAYIHETDSFQEIPLPKRPDHRHIQTLYEDRSNQIWIGTQNGLCYIDNSNRTSAFVHESAQIEQQFNNYSIRTICQDHNKNLWLGSSDGLLKFDTKLNLVIQYQYNIDDLFSISHNDVQQIFEDSSGVLWAGTYGGGVNKFELRRSHFSQKTFASILDKFIYVFAEDRQGNIWIGSNNGIKQLNSEMNIINEYKANSKLINKVSDNRIRSIFIERDGIIWIGSYGGLDKYNPRTGKFINYKHNPDDPYSLSDNTVIQIVEDSKQNLWIGTQNGLNLMDRESEKFFIYQNNPLDPASLSENQIRRIFEDSRGNIWIGTYGGGLNLLNEINNSFTVFKNYSGNPNSISSNFIYSIHEDKNQNLWIGTYGGGLNKFDPETGHFNCFKAKDGLPNELIYGILEDDSGNLWLSTNNGISKYLPAETKNGEGIAVPPFRNYDIGDGLQSNEFNFGAYFKSSKGIMFFGGIDGFNYFHPDSIHDNSKTPEVVLTDFRISNIPVQISNDGPLHKHINQVDKVELSYRDNVFTFEYAALHYSNPAKNKYAYMMEGIDKDWVYTDASRRFATYTTLPGGEYIFKIRAANSDGIWNDRGKSVKVIIKPPFWDTWLFRIYILAFTLLIIAVFIRLRTRQINLRNKYLESINAELNNQIQHRKQVEFELQKSEEKYRTLTTNIHAGIYRIKPDNKGKFVEVNPAMVKLFGYKNKREFLSIPVEELYQNPKEREKYIQDVIKYGHVDNRELYLKKKDGTPVWCSVSAVAVKDAQGNTIYHDGLVEDITEKKLLENRIRQTQKMEAIGQLAGGVAHDFNNILTVIQGHAELGMMKVDKNHKIYKDLSAIHVSGQRAGNLTRQLLAFSRKQLMTLQVVDINSVIRNLEKMVRRLIGEDIKIKINLGPDLPAINADTGQLEQILLNIFINARDAINANSRSPAERIITLDTQYVHLDKDFVRRNPGSNQGPHILIAITDTGIGMDEQIKGKIFDPFFTTKEPGKGTGLGLATVFGIVKQNNGSIYVVSEPGRGTTFTIYWPTIKEKIAPGAKKRKETQKKGGNEKILLVEDDDAVRQFAEDILNNLGYVVVSASDGPMALKKLKREKRPFDLLITDIIMPEMNGRELVEKVIKLSPSTEILLISGYPDNHISIDGKLEKDYAFMQKPFSVNEFGKKVHDVLSKKNKAV